MLVIDNTNLLAFIVNDGVQTCQLKGLNATDGLKLFVFVCVYGYIVILQFADANNLNASHRLGNK
jgi:hypothetical protein